MINKTQKNNKLTEKLILFSNKVKVLYLIFAIYFAILVLYDFLAFKRSVEETITTYSTLVIVGVIVWFSVWLVLRTQISNPICSERIMNIFSLVFVAVFILATFLWGVKYFVEGFTITAFIAPIALTSSIKVQSTREQNK